jgi:hypothetical protein
VQVALPYIDQVLLSVGSEFQRRLVGNEAATCADIAESRGYEGRKDQIQKRLMPSAMEEILVS